MKIVTWNCNMAFRNKASRILKTNPDILVIQECEHPDKLIFPKALPRPTDCLWFGSNLHKGVGIFSYSQFRLTCVEGYNPQLQWVIPIKLTRANKELTLFAIWANNPQDPDGRYITQIWKALQYYEPLLQNKNTILAGDFNSNTIWDRKSRVGNHSDMVKLLEGKGISSAYHRYFRQHQGEEKHPTHYLYRHKDKPYHLDYCFVSENLANKIVSVEIGNHRNWKKYSDHVPVIVSLDNI